MSPSIRSVVNPVLAVALLAGCSTVGSPDVYAPPPASSSSAGMSATASMVKMFHNAAELAADSTALVVGTVTNASSVTIAGTAAIRYAFTVETVLGGSAGTEVTVYRFGEPGVSSTVEGPAFFITGQRYTLFLRPTDLPEGTVGADGFYVVGPGAWGEVSAARFAIWLDDPEKFDVVDIPLEFTLPDAAQLLAADRVGSGS